MGHLPTVLRWLLMLTAVAWVGLELRHSLVSRRPEARRADRGSRPVIGFAAAIGLLLGLGAAQVVPGLAVGDRVVAAWCALLLLWAAMALRLWSIHTLGRYFTLTVQTSPDQPIVTTGPYRYVRHPGYSAFLVAVVAGGLLVGNWLSLVVLLVAVSAGLAYRISVEERALSRDVGSAYREYAATHKRLVPFVW
ncbi:MAG TPA: isoprenylcysteine carboxylmethyltransferase family protein [Lapillicoccus sp.]|nr:isoprenylcysteine carboxylmethyltransferase family protein [Lapillicoccus sp.]